jgi:predicted PurR-regulated permease PerM
MRINPVIVLIILTVGGKLFQLWGLILGVPVCTYIFGHAIQIKNSLSQETQAIPKADA